MRPFLALLALGVVIASAPAVHAATITYTEFAIASGTFDGTAFTNALVTFSATGSTANVTQPAGGIFISVLPTTVTVAGLHTDSFTDTIQFVDNQLVGIAGLGDVSASRAILGTYNAIFNTYDLTTAIGPTSGPNSYESGDAFRTSGGYFILDSIAGNSTFQATIPTTAPTPEPSSLLLLATGSLGLAGALRRRICRQTRR